MLKIKYTQLQIEVMTWIFESEDCPANFKSTAKMLLTQLPLEGTCALVI